jgi:hypothetical protein
VDKYSPASFLELLGDEEMNREVVKWLKSWDACVFGKGRHRPTHRLRSAPTARNEAQAIDDRPKDKILVLCGAPGALAKPPSFPLKFSLAVLVACNDLYSRKTIHLYSETPCPSHRACFE